MRSLENRDWFAFVGQHPLLPSPDRGLRRARASHDLERAMTVGCDQDDLGPPDKLARHVAVADQGLKLRSVGGDEVKADVIASHVTNIAHRADIGNLLSGGEY